MLHWYSKVAIILRKRKNAKETNIVRRRELDVLKKKYHKL